MFTTKHNVIVYYVLLFKKKSGKRGAKAQKMKEILA